MVLSVTDFTFKEEVGNGLILAQFWAPWCGPCKMQTPILEILEEDFSKKFKFIKINIDENPKLAEKFNIMSIPNVLILKDGEMISQFVGYHNQEQVETILNRHI